MADLSGYSDAQLQAKIKELQAAPAPRTDLSKYSDTELQQKIAELSGQSAIGAIGSGIVSGFERAALGIGQLGAQAGVPIAGPEDVVTPPATPEAIAAAPQRAAELVKQREAETAAIQKAHPWLFGAGNVVGGMAATAPLLAMTPTSLPGLGLAGAIGALSEPVSGNALANYWQEKAQQAATGAGYGLLGGALFKNLPAAATEAYNFPKQFINRAQAAAMATPYAQRGLEVAAENKMTLSPAMVSGSRLATHAENAARQSMWSSDKALESYQKLSQEAADRAKTLIDEWTAGRGAPDAAVLGQNLRNTTSAAVTGIQDRASRQWNRDMEEVVKSSPPGFNFDSTKSALNQVIAENDQNLTDAGIKMKAQAGTLLDRIKAAERPDLSKADMGTLVELVDNAYNRAAARYPEATAQILPQDSFGKILNNREALINAYYQLAPLSTLAPEKVLGSKPGSLVSLSQAVRNLGGLDTQYMPDVIGESKLSPTVRKGMPSGLFVRQGGRSPDDMARALVEDGYLHPGDIAGDDGVRAMFSKIGDELSGRQTYYRAEDYPAVMAGQNWEAAMERARNAQVPAEIAPPARDVPLQAAIALRRQFGKAAKGAGNLFTDIHPAEDRRLAGRLFGAMNNDFESSANNAGGDMGAAFRQANKNYRDAMESIDYIEQSILGKLLGQDIADSLYSGNVANTAGAPEQLAQRITKLSPSSLDQVRTILEQHNPALLQDLKAWTLQQAMDRGQTLAPSLGTRVTFAPEKAATGLLKPEQRAALYTPTEQAAIDSFDEALHRWSDKHGYNFSGTAPMGEFLHYVNRFGGGLLSVGPMVAGALFGGPLATVGAAGAAASTGRYIFGTRQVADAMLNPGDRMQLVRLLKLPDGSPQAAKIASYLIGRYGAQENPTGGENSGNAGNQQAGQ